MNRNSEPKQRSHTETELAGLFATYFGDRLTQSQLDSLVASVAEAHAHRRIRAEDSAQRFGPAISNDLSLGLTTGQVSAQSFFGGCAPA